MGKEKITVLQIAPPFLPVSKELYYGGIERVISLLDSQYTQQGEKSIVAATADSEIEGTLFPTLSQSLWQKEGDSQDYSEEIENHFQQVIQYLRHHPEIDIVHDHSGKFVFSQTYFSEKDTPPLPILTTLHNGKTFYKKAIERYPDTYTNSLIYFNTVSQSQKEIFEELLQVDAVVYNGIDVENFPFEIEKKDYLFSLGQICSGKGQDIAIQIAQSLDQSLVIGGTVQQKNQSFFKEKIAPHLNKEKIKYIGPLNDVQKKKWYSQAKAFLMPIRWDEPFGLVMIEALACGTPVIAFRKGAAPEIIEQEVSGYLVDTISEMKDAVKKVDHLSPYVCRKRVEERFSINKQAENYLKLYQHIIENYREKSHEKLQKAI